MFVNGVRGILGGSMEYLTPTEIAKELKVHERTVRRLLNKGKLKGSKIGGSWRISRDNLNEYLGVSNEN